MSPKAKATAKATPKAKGAAKAKPTTLALTAQGLEAMGSMTLEEKMKAYMADGSKGIDEFLKGLPSEQLQVMWKKFEYQRKGTDKDDKDSILVCVLLFVSLVIWCGCGCGPCRLSCQSNKYTMMISKTIMSLLLNMIWSWLWLWCGLSL